MPTDNLHIGFQINDEPSWPQVPICDGENTSLLYSTITKPLAVARSIMHIAGTG